MHVILIPGFWLNAASWGSIPSAVQSAGHTARTLTLPGLSSVDEDRRSIRLADHVAAVVDAIDAAGEPVALVGHSGGGPIAHAAADARPDRVSRVIYVDAVPLADGSAIAPDFEARDGEIPLPDWSVFQPEDLVDLDDRLREAFQSVAVPEPAAVATDAFVLKDERRYDVPVTVICCQMPSAAARELIASGHPYAAELGRIKDVTFVDLPTGHWPQFTRPEDLGAAIIEALK